MSQPSSIMHNLALRAIPQYARLHAAYRDVQAQTARLSAENLALSAQLRQSETKGGDNAVQAAFQYGVDQHWCDSSGIYLQGWVKNPDGPITTLTVIAGAHRCRIDSFLPHPDPGTAAFRAYVPWRASDVLYFEVTAEQHTARHAVDLPPGPIVSGPWTHALPAAPQAEIFGAQELGAAFQTMLEEINSKRLVVCEVGARNVSPGATTKRTAFSGASKYIGVDVHMADNVDVAGDAHYLHELVGEASVDGVFSIAVMEHLSFPWLFAAAVNRALRLGGLTFHLTHQSWPIHEEPNDFWRFSDNALRVLFGPELGFEVLRVGLHDRTFLYPEERREPFGTLPLAVAYSHVFVLARKVRDIDPDAVKWPIAKTDAQAMASLYPKPRQEN